MKYTENQIIAAMKGTGGIISQILNNLEKQTKADGKEFSYNRSTLYKRIDENQALKEAYQSEQERIGDLAETAFSLALQKQEPWAVKEWFKYKGYTRNYVQKQEISNPDGLFSKDALKIEIVNNENKTKRKAKDST